MSIDDIHNLVWAGLWIMAWFTALNSSFEVLENYTAGDIALSLLSGFTTSVCYFGPAAWILSKYI